MKQKDIVIIVFVAGFSALLSLFMTQLFISNEDAYKLKAPVVSNVTSDFTQLNAKYVNPSSLNPTKDITIGDNANQNPFAN